MPDGDNGAAWFVSAGPWFQKIRNDELSLREVSRDFYMQTNALDKFVQRKSHRLPPELPVAYLLVENDPMMDNDRARELIARQTPHAQVQSYGDGDDNDHFLLFSEHRDAAMRDILAFLAGLENAPAGGSAK